MTICIAIAFDICILIFEYLILDFFILDFDIWILNLDKGKYLCFWNYNTEEVETNFAQSGILLHCNPELHILVLQC